MRYIGSKIQLLESIEKVINENKIRGEVFCDIFSGTGSVGRFFKKNYEVISNDILYFSYILQAGTIKNDSIPHFKKLENYLGKNVFDYMDNVEYFTLGKYKDEQFFICNNFSPKGNRSYLSEENAKTIDLWRLELEEWKIKSIIDTDEYNYLLACIIETVPFFSNISGTYGAFLKTWDPRALKKIKLVKLEVPTNRKNNKSFNLDSEKLVDEVSGDILYIDPPYNERQYLPNYHLLETIARYDYPEIKGVTGIRPYKAEKSKFCLRNSVYDVFEKLIKSASFRHILLSYSTDGIMKEKEIVSIMSKYSKNGICKVYRFPHKRFKSRTLVNTSDLHELLFYIDKGDNQIIVEPPSVTLKSPLNYIGGKTKLMPQLKNHFPKKISTFVDLFCGGLNVSLNVSAHKYVANDINKFIVELFIYLKKNRKTDTIEKIESLIKEFDLSKENSEGYLKLRSAYNLRKVPIMLFVLTCYSFNHQIRYNNNFEFNCPFGKNRSSYNRKIKSNLNEFIDYIQDRDFDFLSKDFNLIEWKSLDKESLVYCDPPYFITTGSYNDGKRGFGDWTLEKETELLAYLDKLNKHGIKFALSNVFEHMGQRNELLINWARNYKVINIESEYNNSNYQSSAKKHKTKEVLIVNYT